MNNGENLGPEIQEKPLLDKSKVVKIIKPTAWLLAIAAILWVAHNYYKKDNNNNNGNNITDIKSVIDSLIDRDAIPSQEELNNRFFFAEDGYLPSADIKAAGGATSSGSKKTYTEKEMQKAIDDGKIKQEDYDDARETAQEKIDFANQLKEEYNLGKECGYNTIYTLTFDYYKVGNTISYSDLSDDIKDQLYDYDSKYDTKDEIALRKEYNKGVKEGASMGYDNGKRDGKAAYEAKQQASSNPAYDEKTFENAPVTDEETREDLKDAGVDPDNLLGSGYDIYDENGNKVLRK